MHTAQTSRAESGGIGLAVGAESVRAGERDSRTLPTVFPVRAVWEISLLCSWGPCSLLAPTVPWAAVLAPFLTELCGFRGHRTMSCHRWRGTGSEAPPRPPTLTLLLPVASYPSPLSPCASPPLLSCPFPTSFSFPSPSSSFPHLIHSMCIY